MQGDIRYVGDEIGDGAFIPRTPETVYGLGYGDCKDKAYLMVTALKWLGIDAVPALVHDSAGAALPDRLPSPFAFNHAIVRVRLDGATYWLDPTLTFQYSPDPAYSQVSYGYALPISRDATGLEAIKPVMLLKPQTVESEAFTLGYGEDAPPLVIEVVTRYFGADADSFRRSLADKGLAQVRRDYFDYYDAAYGGIKELAKIQIRDNADSNEIVVTEKYAGTAHDGLDELRRDFPLRGDAVRSWLWEADPKLKNPVKVRFPLFKEHRLRIKNLRSGLEPLDHVWWSRPYLDYSLVSSFANGELSVTWLLRTKRDHVQPAEVKDYAKLADEIDTNTLWYYDVRTDNAKRAEK